MDRSDDVWRYVPKSHKMAYRGRKRVILIGPRGQEILGPYLLRPENSFCFQPRESERVRLAALREKRKSKVQPSQAKRARGRRRLADSYNRTSYACAIRRACRRAFPIPVGLSDVEQRAWIAQHCWAPNQLRHTAASEIRRQFGLEGSQTVLGHAKADTTQIYAERDMGLAAEIMKKIG